MSTQFIEGSVKQGIAIIEDYIFKQGADETNPEDIKVLKLLKCRVNNPDFEYELAEMICGEGENPFPYRSSFYLTSFFERLNLDFQHDGTTRRFWVESVLKQLNIKQVASIIKKGLFYKKDFKKNPKDKNISFEENYARAIETFQNFIDESINANEEIDLAHLLNMNVNTDLLFNQESNTNDQELNELINEAKSRFLKPNDKQIALEKIWDAFERVKTYYSGDKKKSSTQLISKISTDIDKDEFNNEFITLTKIGNNYRIRHHETDKKELTDVRQIDYLFFRVLSLIDLCIIKIRESGD
ncbi:hypothetical protein [Ekhidna sp. To15]|uniref:hypothetical protein n=1 Tax=Ekhidna sp. To15 TaxID=3395267 RepID=UPI003F51B4D1